MKKIVTEALFTGIYAVGLFAFSFLALLAVNAGLGEGLRWTSTTMLKASGVITLLSLPMIVWQSLRHVRRNRVTALTLEELNLNGEELRDAVSLWVFAHKKRRMEGEPNFHRDENDVPVCTVNVIRED